MSDEIKTFTDLVKQIITIKQGRRLMQREEICKWLDVLESELPFDTIYTLEDGKKQSCDVHALIYSIRRNIPNIYHCCNCGTITSSIDKCPVCGSTTFWKYNVEGDELL